MRDIKSEMIESLQEDIKRKLHRLADEAQLTRIFNGLTVLNSLETMREILDDIEAEAVMLAKLERVSWEEIGKALGITRQAAQRRHKGI